jgi:sodium-independent sulfate anion transporter 11
MLNWFVAGIPNAGLSAIIIHAVADLVASPAQAFMFWRVAPLEYVIWLAAVLVTIFSSIGMFSARRSRDFTR